jgi:hypothetical protein
LLLEAILLHRENLKGFSDYETWPTWRTFTKRPVSEDSLAARQA